MEFEVVFVDGAELPGGEPWALAWVGQVFYAFIDRARVTAAVLSEAWRAFMEWTGAVIPTPPLAAAS